MGLVGTGLARTTQVGTDRQTVRNTRAMSIIDISDGTCAHPSHVLSGTTLARRIRAHCCGQYCRLGSFGLRTHQHFGVCARHVLTYQLKVAAEAQKLRQADRRVLRGRKCSAADWSAAKSPPVGPSLQINPNAARVLLAPPEGCAHRLAGFLPGLRRGLPSALEVGVVAHQLHRSRRRRVRTWTTMACVCGMR